jgi:hypothetical protein
MVDPTTVATTIRGELERIASSAMKSGNYRDREWTRQIKEMLCELGVRLKCDVSAAGCPGATDGEWVFDLAWSRSEGSRFLRLPFAMESEWSTSPYDILWDFGKLIIAKADLKLFVFQQRTEDEMTEMMNKLHGAIDDFEVKIPGEHYLLAGYRIHAGAFAFEQH